MRPAYDARIRAAKAAAFFALSTPTAATGTPGGICAIASSASSPSRTLRLERSGTPITGRSVIGVPLRSSLSVLDGLDALLAIAQMPPGVPVAAVGVDNAKNAAALAARILAS